MKLTGLVKLSQIPKETISTPIDNLVALYDICSQMEFICKLKGGIGLSVVQVGLPWKLFIRQMPEGFRYYVNCEYVGSGEKIDSIEGCLSITTQLGKSRHFKLNRYPKVNVNGFELKYEPELQLVELNEELEGLDAIVVQHEIDHQNNILISDIGVELQVGVRNF